MTSSISGNYGSVGMMHQHHRPDPSQMASKLFSKLDSKNQGYIEKSDLESALANVSNSNSSDSSANADAIFSQLDGDGDGKITKDEMTSGIQKLADQLHSQFDQMRMNGYGGQDAQGMSGMPPPPPPGGPNGQDGQDSGFTKDELQSQLQDIGSSDSKRADFISKIIDNFSQADSDGDGKVNFKEARAFEQSQNSSSSSSDSSSTSSAGAESTQAQLMHKIMQLMHAYGGQENSVAAGSLSISA